MIYTRSSIDTLSATDPVVTGYKTAIDTMKKRSQANPNDPLGWIYQANIHGSPTSPAQPLWNGCQHGTYFFLSWHRMFIWYFESIVRSFSGVSDWALPYWDWTNYRALPQVFRQPASASNPLWIRERATRINGGTPMDPRVVDYSVAFSYTNFSSPPGSGLSFGGQAQGPIHLSSNPVFGQFENQPHNNIHDVVGGPRGYMAYPNLAARDPIFWLHHANIDRLWKRWLDLGGGRSDPTGDTKWMGQPFTFYDAQGTQQTLTGAEILDTMKAPLDYRYADDPAAAGDDAGGAASLETSAAASITLRPDNTGPSRASAPVHLGASRESGISLGRQRRRVEVPVEAGTGRGPGGGDLEGGAASAGTADLVTEGDRVVVRLEGVGAASNPGIGYAVYVDVSGNGTGAGERYYAGNISFFGIGRHPDQAAEDDGSGGHGHEGHAGHGGHGAAGHAGHGGHEGGHPVHEAADVHLDITPVVNRLRAAGTWNPDHVAVEFEPIGVEGGAGVDVGGPASLAGDDDADAVPAANPRVERVRLTRE